MIFCCRTTIGIAYYLHEFRYSWDELKCAANKEGGREASSSSTLADPVKETRREATFPAAQTWTILAKNSSGSAPYHTDGSKMQTVHHILLPVFCLDSRRSRSPTPVLTTGAKTTGQTAAEIYTSLPSSCVYSFAETSRQRSACEAGSVHDTLSYHSFVVLPPIAFFDPLACYPLQPESILLILPPCCTIWFAAPRDSLKAKHSLCHFWCVDIYITDSRWT